VFGEARAECLDDVEEVVDEGAGGVFAADLAAFGGVAVGQVGALAPVGAGP